MTYLELARQYFPNATDDELDYILWEYTGFPSFYRDLDELKKQLQEAKEELNK